MVHAGSLGVFAALAFLIVSGVLNGSSAAPLKYAKRSEWENLWLIQSIVAMIILPWLLVWATVPEPMHIYRASGFWPIAAAAGFGFGWGAGTLLYIIGVVMVGMSVSFTIIMSLTATLGSLFPLLVLHPHELHSHRGHLLLLALGATVIGIVFCAYAGAGRIEENPGSAQQKARRYFWDGIVVCVLSGIFSPLLNFAFAFGNHIITTAAQFGSHSLWAPNALWAIVFSSAFGLNAVYCLRHLGLSTSWRRFLDAPWENLFGGSLMGILLLASIIMYGIGAEGLGAWGASTGWAINMSTTIFAANAWGLITGEWRNASRKAYVLLAIGLTAITVAIILASPTSSIS
jgi:L-rhamnose-H+ transport protein